VEHRSKKKEPAIDIAQVTYSLTISRISMNTDEILMNSASMALKGRRFAELLPRTDLCLTPEAPCAAKSGPVGFPSPSQAAAPHALLPRQAFASRYCTNLH
jgi:hypothetical protein